MTAFARLYNRATKSLETPHYRNSVNYEHTNIMSESKDIAAVVRALQLRDAFDLALCMPASVTDCRKAETMVQKSHEMDGQRRLFRLQFRGDMVGYDSNKRVLFTRSRGQPDRLIGSPKNVRRLSISLFDSAGIHLDWSVFNGQFFAFRNLPPQELYILARIERYGSKVVLKDAEMLAEGVDIVNSIWVKYPGIPGKIASERIGAAIAQMRGPDPANPEAPEGSRWDRAIRRCATTIIGQIGIPELDILRDIAHWGADKKNPTIEMLLTHLHTPVTLQDFYTAREACMHIAAASVQAAAIRHNKRTQNPMAPVPIDIDLINKLEASQKEVLTIEQRTAIMDIAQSMRQPVPLSGLLSGDVGTGKTLVYAYPAVAAHMAQARVMIVAPTQILADQIANQFVTRFAGQGVRVERVQTGRKIKDPDAILVGTMGMITAAKKIDYEPNLLICDEQHKMASAVRETLLHAHTHFLEVSATPIPRSMASALYGGMKIYTIKNRAVPNHIESKLTDENERRVWVRAIKHAMENGDRVAIIYPRIDSDSDFVDDTGAEDETTASQPKQSAPNAEKNAVGVVDAAKTLDCAFPGRVGFLHSQMDDEAKIAALDAFRSGERPIIVASTILETGIDVPDIRVMIVREPERFGVSQLHQLRGRLARNGGEAHFVMMTKNLELLDETTVQRLQTVAETTDGFRLAELDMLQRGIGDLDGDRQSGAADCVFKLTKLSPDHFLANRFDLALSVKNDPPPSRHLPDAAERQAPRQRGLF